MSDANRSMSDSEDVRPDAIWANWEITDVKPDVNITNWDTEDVKPDTNLTKWDLEDVKPAAAANIWAGKDVKPVVKSEEPDTLEEEKPCIEALRASLLASEENFRRKASITSGAADSRQVDNATKSSVTSCHPGVNFTCVTSGNVFTLSSLLLCYKHVVRVSYTPSYLKISA